ncbi:MAG: energy transducer TonB [Bdellovibrionaceae bacterium]|nr:energy transducer TonB [Pseudobdellovibrionaceae bacterium]MDW8189534.1 energy transducer TonB [Pseudobdellovibrionaceae bacterium]
MGRYAVGSLTLHFLIFLLLYVTNQIWEQSQIRNQQHANYLEVDLSSNSSNQTTNEDSALKKQKYIPNQRIVDQPEQPLNNEIPENQRFLSAHNQKVIKETKAAKRGEFRNSPHQWQKKFQPISRFLNPVTSKNESDSKINQEEKEKVISALSPIPSPLQPYPPTDRNPASPSENPSNPTAHQDLEGSATLDYLPDIEEGLETLLSTREFVYYTYYRRIRNQLHQYWTPKVRNSLIKIYKQGRRIATDTDLVTRCLIILNSQGRLLKVYIIGNSGFKELDEAAFEALKEAAPFRNPPKGMIDPDGLVRIRWDFIIEG